MSHPPSVLFVCLGNICRSPLAELAMRVVADAARQPMRIDSAGTSDWHIGSAPDPRARAAARQLGHAIDDYRARQVAGEDFYDFDYIIALDRQNLADLRVIAPADASAQLHLLCDFIPGRAGEGVADPYYLDDAAFFTTWDEVRSGAEGILADLQAKG